MKQIWLMLVLTVMNVNAYAVTITTVGGYPSLISGLEVQGTTYDGWFGWTTPGTLSDPDQFPFIGSQVAAANAANQLAQALNDGGYQNVDRAWLDYFFVPFEDQFEISVQAYKGQFRDGEWLVTIETTHGVSPANSWVLLSAVPIPATVWLFGSGLIALIGVARRKQT